jgi:Protein of unknown function (DUF1566)
LEGTLKANNRFLLTAALVAMLVTACGGAGVVTTPDAFSFVDQTSVALSTLTESAAITVAGINAAASISVTGGEYQINGGAWASSGTVTNGQSVKVRHTSSVSNSTATNTVLTIGGVSDTFTTTTVASLPAGFIQQPVGGGVVLTWTPDTFSGLSGYADWTTANNYCTTTTINGQTGWRLPTTVELLSLYDSGLLAGQGWMLGITWSSTPVDPEAHVTVYMYYRHIDWTSDVYPAGSVSCVR